MWHIFRLFDKTTGLKQVSIPMVQRLNQRTKLFYIISNFSTHIWRSNRPGLLDWKRGWNPSHGSHTTTSRQWLGFKIPTWTMRSGNKNSDADSDETNLVRGVARVNPSRKGYHLRSSAFFFLVNYLLLNMLNYHLHHIDIQVMNCHLHHIDILCVSNMNKGEMNNFVYYSKIVNELIVDDR
jgi:hypothetical protein